MDKKKLNPEAGLDSAASTDNNPPEEEGADNYGQAEDQKSTSPKQGQENDTDKLKEEIQRKTEEAAKFCQDLENLKDLLQRRQADFDNFRKRTLKLQEETKKYALRDFSLDIIKINDDLLMAIEASRCIPEEVSSEGTQCLVDGVLMISKRIEEILKKYHIVEIDTLNKEFDPNLHEALEIEMSPDVEKDTVVTVFQKGFKMDDIVVRSSKVKVAKPLKDAQKGADEEKKDEAIQ